LNARIHFNLDVPIFYGLILWVISKFFPNNVYIGSLSTLILAAILIWIVSLIVAAIGMAIILVGALTPSVAIIVFGVLMITLANTFAIVFLSDHLANFSVNGVWPLLAIAVLFSFINAYAGVGE
jgi:hypothetical protein